MQGSGFRLHECDITLQIGILAKYCISFPGPDLEKSHFFVFGSRGRIQSSRVENLTVCDGEHSPDSGDRDDVERVRPERWDHLLFGYGVSGTGFRVWARGSGFGLNGVVGASEHDKYLFFAAT